MIFKNRDEVNEAEFYRKTRIFHSINIYNKKNIPCLIDEKMNVNLLVKSVGIYTMVSGWNKRFKSGHMTVSNYLEKTFTWKKTCAQWMIDHKERQYRALSVFKNTKKSNLDKIKGYFTRANNIMLFFSSRVCLHFHRHFILILKSIKSQDHLIIWFIIKFIYLFFYQQ
jgi:hypothetical protein